MHELTLNPLEQLLQGAWRASDCATEGDYYTLWRSHGLDELEPVAMAVAGAALADRLAWVFCAGYQACLRNAFDRLPAGGWAAFAATEDVHNPQAHPGTTLSEHAGQLCLDGHKSWVAHSRLVDHLIITVNDPGGDKRRARGVVVDPRADGVHLRHRERPAFLAAISQGYARFEYTPIARDAVFEFEPIRQFGRTEAKFVMLASAVFIYTRSADDLASRALACAAALTALLAERDTSRRVYARIEQDFQRCAELFERESDLTSIPDYADDRRLLQMYSARIQRRARYADEEN